jgi:hypothetical protein
MMDLDPEAEMNGRVCGRFRCRVYEIRCTDWMFFCFFLVLENGV